MLKRRQFLKSSLIGAASLLSITQLLFKKAYAAMPKVDRKKDQQAKGLAYYPDAKTYYQKGHPKKLDPAINKTPAEVLAFKKQGAKCLNCAIYGTSKVIDAGKPTEFGSCAVFPGKLVSANGMCNTYVKKA